MEQSPWEDDSCSAGQDFLPFIEATFITVHTRAHHRIPPEPDESSPQNSHSIKDPF
jgi:hypothetical protein